MKSTITAALALAVAGLVCSAATAQQRHPFDRPVTSPYLMLLDQPPANLAGAYFRRVRPEMQWRQRTQALGRGLTQLETNLQETRRLIQSPTSGLGPTGHAVAFGPNTRFFPGR